MTLSAAIYCRISRDRTGAGLGVDRQEEDCRALAERLGWSVAAVYVDNDLSAYSGKPRPGYREMLRAVRAGQVSAILAWHPDRLHRRMSELEEFVTLAEECGLSVQTVTAGMVDLSSASGRMVARMLGAAAQHEVDHARERMRRAKAQMAADGRYRGGMRPYGYEADGVTVRGGEAVVVQEAMAQVLAGRTLAALARELNERAATTSTGRPWTYQRLRDVLLRPRNAGLLSRGRASRPEELVVVGPAAWPALVDEDTWRAVYGVLTAPARRSAGSTEPRWLGSGLYRCGRCGGPMRAAPYGQGGGRSYHYRCTTSAHLTVHAGRTDDYVRAAVVDLVRDPRVVAALAAGSDGGGRGQVSADRARRAVLAARLGQFEDDYAAGAITGAQLHGATARVEEELTEIEARLTRAAQRSASSPIVAAPDPGAAFLGAPLDVQRAVLVAVLRVEIAPASYPGTHWSPGRVHFSNAAATVPQTEHLAGQPGN